MIKKTLVGLALSTALASSAANLSGDISTHYDTRQYSTFTLNLYGHDLPGKTDFFGFVDSFQDKNDKFEWEQYGEFRLSKKFWQGIGPAVEYNRDFSAPYGVTRAGVVFSPRLPVKNSFVEMAFFPAATHQDGMQVVISGKKEFNEGDMYVSGFLDYNLKPQKVLTEVQVGKRIHKNVFGVLELRFNDFLPKDEFGMALGLEYKF